MSGIILLTRLLSLSPFKSFAKRIEISTFWFLLLCSCWTDPNGGVEGFSTKLKQQSQDIFIKQLTSEKPSLLRRMDQFLTKLQNPNQQLQDHTYLTGNYAPVLEENITPVPVTEVVEGSIPANLNGMFCRNGPNPNPQRKIRKLYHWFDGSAMLHNLRIENGKAIYTNQYAPSFRHEIEEELDEDFFPTLGEYTGIFGLFKILFHPNMVRERIENLVVVAPPNTNVLMFDNKFYCLHEANFPLECRILPNGKIERVGYETFDGKLDFPISAHPRVDGNDLLFHSYTVDQEIINEQGIMKVGRYDATKKQLASYFVPTPHKDYIPFAHNMVHTENYMIVWDCSVHFDPAAMFDGGSYFRTKSEHNLKFGIIPKSATSKEEVMWIDTGKPGAIVHPLNAWEEIDEYGDPVIALWTPLCDNLVIDLESDEINQFYMAEFQFKPSASAEKDRCSMTVIDDTINVEFSVVPEMGRFTRYGYTAIQDKSTPGEGSFSGFCIWDMVERTYRAVYYPDQEVGGEPMVARQDDKIYLGTYTYNMAEDQTYFVLYDGETSASVCKLKMPHRVPFGFHGQWISGEELQGHFEHHGTLEKEFGPV